MCQHHPARPAPSLAPERHGYRLEDGEAHTADHARWSRRDFLMHLGAAAAGVSFSLGATPMSVFGRSPLMGPVSARDGGPILVLLQLAGGNDGLNTVVPVNNDIYYSRRPQIAIPKQQSILLDDETGLHPAMASLRPLWDDGQMAVVHNVGYERQSRSHFRGTDIWATGVDHDEFDSTGWTGRYLEGEYDDYLQNPPEYPLAVRVGGAPASLFQSRYGNLSVTFADAGQFQRFVEQGGFYDVEAVPDTVFGSELAYVRSVTNASYRYVGSVQSAAERASNLVEYPGSVGQSLAVVARLIRGGLGAPVYTVSKGGFDTHSDQGGVMGRHADLVGNVADSVAAFLADLAEDGLDERVVVMTFSEFGRTLGQNGSGGTDHGAGAPLFLFGKGLRGGLYGTPSDLVDLYGGDPRYTTDYRSIYGTLLADWFGLPAEQTRDVLGGDYASLGFVGASPVATDAPAEVPAAFRLEPNYPNPFNPSTRLAFTLARSGPVRLAVYDLQGRHVRTLLDGHRAAGRHEVDFRPEGLPSGTYFYRLRTQDGLASRRMTLIK